MDLLVNRDFIFTKADLRKNTYIPFLVSKKYRKLVVCWSYRHDATDVQAIRRDVMEGIHRYVDPELWPDTEEGLENKLWISNFISLSLDSSHGYLGCAHRQYSNLVVEISQDDASVGFDPSEIIPGRWSVALHVHWIVEREVHGKLRIYALNEEDSDDLIPTL